MARINTDVQGVQQSLLHQQSKHILLQMAQINTDVQGVQQSLLHQQSKRYPPTERTERTEVL